MNIRRLVEHKLLREEWYKNEELSKLFDKLVPATGVASTNAGEVVRAVNRVIYRYYNDGDKFFEGYGIQTCGPSVLWLREVAGGKVRNVAKESTEGMSDEEYESWLADLGNAAVEYIKNPGDDYEKQWLGLAPEADSRDYQENNLPWEEDEEEENNWYYNNENEEDEESNENYY